jgi:hypothetical protein
VIGPFERKDKIMSIETLNSAVGPGSVFQKDPLTQTSLVISNGTSITAALDCLGVMPVGIFLPAAWTAAVMTFQVSPDNSNWYNLYDKVGEVSYPAAASEWLALDPAQFAGVRYLKCRSGTSGTPVNQLAERSLGVVLRSVA